MYVEFLVDAPELKELFADYIGYWLLSKRLRENRTSQRDGIGLGITRNYQEASAALHQAVEANYPPNFRTYIPTAVERIIQRTPDAESFFIERLNSKSAVPRRKTPLGAIVSNRER